MVSYLPLPPYSNTNDLREAFEKLYNFYSELTPHLILIGHIKSVFISKEGAGEIQANDVDLTGKIRGMTCADMDAIGLVRRVKNQTIVSFKTAEDDVICGARNEHLRGQEFVICEYDKGKFTYHWDKIFI